MGRQAHSIETDSRAIRPGSYANDRLCRLHPPHALCQRYAMMAAPALPSEPVATAHSTNRDQCRGGDRRAHHVDQAHGPHLRPVALRHGAGRPLGYSPKLQSSPIPVADSCRARPGPGDGSARRSQARAA